MRYSEANAILFEKFQKTKFHTHDMTLRLSKNNWAIALFETFQSGTNLTCYSHCRSSCMNPKRQGAQTRLQTAVSARVQLGWKADHFCIYVSDIYRNPNRLLYCCNLALSPGKYICLHWYSFAAMVQLFIQMPVGSFKVVYLDLDIDTALLLSLG